MDSDPQLLVLHRTSLAGTPAEFWRNIDFSKNCSYTAEDGMNELQVEFSQYVPERGGGKVRFDAEASRDGCRIGTWTTWVPVFDHGLASSPTDLMSALVTSLGAAFWVSISDAEEAWTFHLKRRNSEPLPIELFVIRESLDTGNVGLVVRCVIDSDFGGRWAGKDSILNCFDVGLDRET